MLKEKTDDSREIEKGLHMIKEGLLTMLLSDFLMLESFQRDIVNAYSVRSSKLPTQRCN